MKQVLIFHVGGSPLIISKVYKSGNNSVSILFRNIETSFSFPPKMTAERNGNGLLGRGLRDGKVREGQLFFVFQPFYYLNFKQYTSKLNFRKEKKEGKGKKGEGKRKEEIQEKRKWATHKENSVTV